MAYWLDLVLIVFTTYFRRLLLKAMYLQLRADTMNERLVCGYDEALSLAALALQGEIGDFKQVGQSPSSI